MEKIKKCFYNSAFYVLMVLLCVAFVVLMLNAVWHIHSCAAENVKEEPVCILIDAGHGGEDGGAVSDDGVVEKDINLAISQYLRDYFELSGCNVLMTREDDAALGDITLPTVKERKRSDMKERLEMYNNEEVDCVISIHQNKFTSSQYSGAQVFYSANDSGSEVLAECLRKAVVSFIQPNNDRELKQADSNIYLLNNCVNPCVLVECGFLSNAEETARLVTEEYQKQVAFSIYCGTLEYLSDKGRVKTE